jgi:hypothetical protein
VYRSVLDLTDFVPFSLTTLCLRGWLQYACEVAYCFWLLLFLWMWSATFQYSSAHSTVQLKIQYFCCFSMLLVRWYIGGACIFCKKCVQIQLIVILCFLIKMMNNVTVKFKVSVDPLLLHDYHDVMHIVCESVYIMFKISSYTEQLLCDFYVCNI